MLDRADAVLAPGLRLDRYELLCPLAKGGMAEVWAGRQFGKHGFQRLVAIKTILSAHASEERARQMFLEEGRLAASIRHPNVAAIYDLGDEHDLLFLVLEYVEGDSLAQLERAARSRGVPIPLGVALRIVSDTCQALHAAHELRAPDGRLTTVVQRDVSPQNVLLSSAGAVKVIDFGIAKILDQVRQETSSGLIKGKLQYMAPEQALGRAVDRRADVWGAGATLYHLLSGRPPIQGSNELETLHFLTSGRDPAPLRDAPQAVREIVARALQYEPEDRFETAEQMHHALERAIHDLCGVITSADVAKVVDTHLAQRIAQRQNMVRKACSAADDRAHLAAEFDRAASSSNEPGVTPQHSQVPALAPTVRREREPSPPGRAPARRRMGAVGVGVSVGAALFVIFWVILGVTRREAAQSGREVEVIAGQPTVLTASPQLEPAPVAAQPIAQPAATQEAEQAAAPPPPRATARPRATKPRGESPLDVVKTRH